MDTTHPHTDQTRSRRLQALRNVLSPAVGVPICAYLASRLALFLIGWFTFAFLIPNPAAPSLHQIFDLTCRWDCGWYLSIAQHGYSTISPSIQPGATNLAFWPALPFAARWLSDVTGMSIVGSGDILTNIAFILSLILLRKYCLELDLKEHTATFAVFLLAFAPQSYVFSGFYTESFCLLGILGSMYCARRNQWWASGAFAIFTTLSRPTGVFLMLFLIVYAYQVVGWRGFIKPWKDARPFIPVVLLPAGQLTVMAIAYYVSGDAFAQAHTAAAGWYVGFEAPWVNIPKHLRGSPRDILLTTSILVIFLSIIPLIYKRLFPDVTFAVGIFLLLLCSTVDQSILRYTLIVPPIFIGIAVAMDKHQYLRYSVLSIFAMLSSAFFSAWTLALIIAA